MKTRDLCCAEHLNMPCPCCGEDREYEVIGGENNPAYAPGVMVGIYRTYDRFGWTAACPACLKKFDVELQCDIDEIETYADDNPDSEHLRFKDRRKNSDDELLLVCPHCKRSAYTQVDTCFVDHLYTDGTAKCPVCGRRYMVDMTFTPSMFNCTPVGSRVTKFCLAKRIADMN